MWGQGAGSCVRREVWEQGGVGAGRCEGRGQGAVGEGPGGWLAAPCLVAPAWRGAALGPSQSMCAHVPAALRGLMFPPLPTAPPARPLPRAPAGRSRPTRGRPAPLWRLITRGSIWRWAARTRASMGKSRCGDGPPGGAPGLFGPSGPQQGAPRPPTRPLELAGHSCAWSAPWREGMGGSPCSPPLLLPCMSPRLAPSPRPRARRTGRWCAASPTCPRRACRR